MVLLTQPSIDAREGAVPHVDFWHSYHKRAPTVRLRSRYRGLEGKTLYIKPLSAPSGTLHGSLPYPKVNGSDMPDAEKIRWGKARQAQRQGPTIRDRYEAAIADETVDPLTRSLLRWFSDVEADSGARLRAIYDRIEAQAG